MVAIKCGFIINEQKKAKKSQSSRYINHVNVCLSAVCMCVDNMCPGEFIGCYDNFDGFDIEI